MRMALEVGIVFSPFAVFAGVGVLTRSPFLALGFGLLSAILARVIGWVIGIA